MEQQTEITTVEEQVSQTEAAGEVSAAEIQPAAQEDSTTDEFLRLQQQVPELQGVQQVPKEVFETARCENISLFDAFLRYRYREQQAIAAEQLRQQRTAELSVGSLHTGALRAAPVSDAFARAFEKALS